MSKTYTQEELDSIIKEKSEQSFKAGLTKGKSQSEFSSSEKEALEKQLRESEEAHKATLKELKPFQEKEAFKAVSKSFAETKKGKEGVDLSNYNYGKFANEKGEVDWDKFLESNPHLKAEQKKIKEDKTLEEQQLVKKQMEEHLNKEYSTERKLPNV